MPGAGNSEGGEGSCTGEYMLWAKWQGVISPVGELRHPGFSLFLEGNTIKGRTSNCMKKKSERINELLVLQGAEENL